MDDEGGKKFLLMLFFVYWIPMRDVVMDLESFPCLLYTSGTIILIRKNRIFWENTYEVTPYEKRKMDRGRPVVWKKRYSLLILTEH